MAAEALQALIASGREFDEQGVRILGSAINQLYNGTTQERQSVHGVLAAFQQHPEAWRQVQTILSFSRDEHVHFFALGILQKTIQSRWQLLPEAERAFVPDYLIKLSVAAACGNSSSQATRTKINEVIVEVARRTWPDQWPTFITDLCQAAQADQKICENNLQILNLLSEDILDFGSDQMTSRKCQELTSRLGSEFKSIFDLCLFVLKQYHESPKSVTPSLIQTTLKCLSSFIRWNDPNYILSTDIHNFLIDHFWEPIDHRIDCVSCFTEIFGRQGLSPKALEEMTQCWLKFLSNVSRLPPQSFEYETKVPSNARDFWERLYQHIALSCTVFCRHYFTSVVEGRDSSAARILGHIGISPQKLVSETLDILLKLTKMPNEETFKIMVEFWHDFCESVYRERNLPDRMNIEMELISLRRILIGRMARPPEVYIVYDEDSGSVDRDYTPDTDEIALYNIMRQTSVLLCNISEIETERLMLDVLTKFTESVQRDLNQENWNPAVLNRLCWSIGSVSGAMSPPTERAFLVQVLRSLLWFCEVKKGKENKALVASMIMYVCGQYPRFLKANVNLLKVVVMKNFEFMSEIFPGVQDMATETFYKIASGCKEKLSVMTDPQNGDRFIRQILMNLPVLSKDLQTIKQSLLLYHSVAIIISSAERTEQPVLIDALLSTLNAEWTQKMAQIQSQPEIVTLPIDILRRVTEILQINERIAEAAGPTFDRQFQFMFNLLLQLYAQYGIRFKEVVAQGFVNQLNHAAPREMRNTRRAVLRLMETFVNKAGANDKQARQVIVTQILPPLLNTVFGDYRNLPPQLRDAEVLNLTTSLLNNLCVEVEPHFVEMFSAIFTPTLEMIKSDYDSYPEIRLAFYTLNLAVIRKCFKYVTHLDGDTLRHLIASLIYAIQDEKPEIAALGLKTMFAMMQKTRLNVDAIAGFAQLFYVDILRTTIGVLTDTLHTAGFRDQCAILQELALWTDLPQLNQPASPLTKASIIEHTKVMLRDAFPNLNEAQIDIFVLKVFSLSTAPADTFERVVRDFIVQLREHGGAKELFEAERLEALKLAEDRQSKLAMIPGYVQGQVN